MLGCRINNTFYIQIKLHVNKIELGQTMIYKEYLFVVIQILLIHRSQKHSFSRCFSAGTQHLLVSACACCCHLLSSRNKEKNSTRSRQTDLAPAPAVRHVLLISAGQYFIHVCGSGIANPIDTKRDTGTHSNWLFLWLHKLSTSWYLMHDT